MRVVGVLSGTSCDSIEVCVCDIASSPETAESAESATKITRAQDYQYKITLVCHESIPYEQEVREQIFKLINSTSSQPACARDFCRTNFTIGQSFANAIEKTLLKHQIDAKTIQAIGNHGQTIWHEVETIEATASSSLSLQNKVHSTLQLGESAVIAAKIGVPVIDQFRVMDVALGGQGAPLTSILDACLMRPKAAAESNKKVWRALQNLGGIGNVTFVCSDPNEKVISFDTGPANSMIDDAVRLATNFQTHFDADGHMAKLGKLNNELLSHIMSLPYFSQKPPKTTGRELFGMNNVKTWYEKGKNQLGMSEYDIIRTLTQVTVDSIVNAYYDFWYVNQKEDLVFKDIIISGGGRHNKFLIELVKERVAEKFGEGVKVLSNEELHKHGGNDNYINSDAKESILFAFLAYLYETRRTGNIPEVTGASKACILGKKILPPPADN